MTMWDLMSIAIDLLKALILAAIFLVILYPIAMLLAAYLGAGD